MKIHELKCEPEYFRSVLDGLKNFEIRKDDRDFRQGDELLLKEFIPKDYWDPCDPKQDEYSGRILHRRIVYLIRNFEGLTPGYVILGLKKL